MKNEQEQVEVIDKEGTVIGQAEVSTAVAITTEVASELANFAQEVKNGTTKPKMSTAAKYWEPAKQGEKCVGLFTGFSIIKKNENGAQKDIQVATWIAQGEDGEICRYMQGGVVTVDAFRPVPLKAKFVITYEGKTGKTKNFTVQVY